MKEDILQPTFYQVTRTQRETDDTVTLEVQGEPMEVAPGQFNMLYAFGIGEAPISISGYSQNGDTLLYTIRAVGKVTQALCRMEPGETIGVRGPFGTRWPLERFREKRPLLIAGGIGLAPLRPLLMRVLDEPDTYIEPTLLYGSRTPNDMLYTDQLHAWKEAAIGHIHTTVDFADPAWLGNIGVVPDLLNRVAPTISSSIACICGPEIMMRFTIRKLLELGMPEENIYLSMERNMQCAIGHCGHCQYVGDFVCKDGAVFPYVRLKRFFDKKEI